MNTKILKKLQNKVNNTLEKIGDKNTEIQYALELAEEKIEYIENANPKHFQNHDEEIEKAYLQLETIKSQAGLYELEDELKANENNLIQFVKSSLGELPNDLKELFEKAQKNYVIRCDLMVYVLNL